MMFVGGISSQIEGEEGTNGNGDRADLDLPAVQQELLEAVATRQAYDRRVDERQRPERQLGAGACPAILEAWYSGEEGGTAIADVLFGDYNPAGRLPLTFYTGMDQLPPFRDYAMKSRTYRYFDGKPLYPFGYGFSYTRVPLQRSETARSSRAGQAVTVRRKWKISGHAQATKSRNCTCVPRLMLLSGRSGRASRCPVLSLPDLRGSL